MWICHLLFLVIVSLCSWAVAGEKGVKPAAAFVASEPCDKGLTPYAQRSMRNFMVLNPEPVPGHPDLLRVRFDCYGTPPSIAFNQWGWGDGTGRAVEAWPQARQMTGDRESGRKVEEGQRKLLLWFLTPETGMAQMPDGSHPEKGTYYYDGWDQGRVLRALVRWWLAANDAAEKQTLAIKINKMIGSLDRLATKHVDPRWGPTAQIPHQVLDNGQPRDSFCGDASGGQLIEPLALYWPACNDPSARSFADALCNGVLANFGPDGSFEGHFHNKTSIVLGVARQGVALIRHGERDRGLRLLRLAKSADDWILSPANVNQGSTWGWFPENVGDGKQARTIMEVCCTADMIELAAVLAGAANLDPTLADYDGLWDHLERYTLNTIIPLQFVVTPAYTDLIAKRGGDLKVAEQLVGAWAGYHPPNDLVTFERGDGKLEMLMGSCCNYAGIRGLYACWENAISDDGTHLVVRLPVARQAPAASQTVVEGPKEVRQVLRLVADRDVRVRIPDWAAINQVAARGRDGATCRFSVEGRYLNFGKLQQGTEVIVTYLCHSHWGGKEA